MKEIAVGQGVEGALAERFEEGASAFFSYLDVTRNLSPHTLRAYHSDIAEFLSWWPMLLSSLPDERRHDIPFAEMPGAYVAYLSGRGLSKTSVARKGSALKTFFKFLMKERYFDEHSLPIVFYRPKLPRRLPAFLSEEEVSALLSVLERMPDSPLKDRNRALLEVLFSSGIRVGELALLNRGDLAWEEAELRIQGKGGRERIAFLSQRAMDALRVYLHRAWPALCADAPLMESPLFLNRDGERLNVRSVRRMLLELGEATGLNKPLRPHVFRHTFATHLLNHGVDLRIVQELLGHVSIRSTQVYTHISTERLKRAYLKAHPRAVGAEARQAHL